MKRTIDRETLSRLYPPMDAAFEADMRRRLDALPREKEAKRMKRGTFAAVLAAALLLATAATALAVAVSQGFFKEAAELPLSSSYYARWTLGEKEAVARLLLQYGLTEDAQAWSDALEKPGARAKEKALDALFMADYGQRGSESMLSLETIMEAEIGVYDPAWSLAQKAAYCEMMLDLDLLGFDTNIDMLPGEGDIAPEEAEAIAKAALREAYGLTDAQEIALSEISFSVHRSRVNAEPPHYEVMLTVRRDGREETESVAVARDGHVITSADGYKDIRSPKERAADVRVPRSEEEAAHSAQMERHRQAIRPAAVCFRTDWERDNVETLLALADGTALALGYRQAQDSGRTAHAFAACMDESGEVRWRAEVAPQDADEALRTETAMQLENGDILWMLVRRKTQGQEILYDRCEQIRLSPDGRIVETTPLPSAAALSGLDAWAYDAVWGQPGHGGLLTHGVAGEKHIRYYAQLDAAGRKAFTLTLEDWRGSPAYLYTIPQGYVLCVWNEAANMTRLRFYDEQGNFLREGEDDPQRAGVRITEVLGEDNGGLVVTSHFVKGEGQTLLRLDASGRVLERRSIPSGRAIDTAEIVRTGDRYVFLCQHGLDEALAFGQHTGLSVFDGEGGAEYYVPGMDEPENVFGVSHQAAPIGQGKLLVSNVSNDGWNNERSLYEGMASHLAVIELP